MPTPVYEQDGQYTQNTENEYLIYEDLHKNSNGDLIKVVRRFRDKWQPGVNDDIIYTQVYEQRDPLGALLGSPYNDTAVIVRVYPKPVRTQDVPV